MYNSNAYLTRKVDVKHPLHPSSILTTTYHLIETINSRPWREART